MVYFKKRRYSHKRKRTWKSKYSSKYSNSKFRRSYHRNKQNTRMVKVGAPFPPCIATKNNWAETSADIAQATPGAPTVQTLLNLNSAFDPAAAPGLSQESVQYHDIYTRYYSDYTVTYVKVNLKWRNTGTNDCRIVCGIADDSQTPGQMGSINMNEMQMQNYTQTRVLESDQGSKYNRGNMTFKFNIAKWWKRMKLDPEDYSSTTPSNPLQSPVLWYAIKSENAALTALCKVDITATFYTKYSRRRDAAIMGAQ